LTLRVRCSNGHALSVKDDLAGQRVRCPKCKVLFRAQAGGEEEKPDSPIAPPSKKRKKSADRSNGVRRPSVRDEDDDADGSDEATPEERRKERQRQKKQSLVHVKTGLIIHTVKLWAFVVLVFFLFLWWVFGLTVENANLPDSGLDKESVATYKTAVETFQNILLFLIVLTPVVGVIGSVFCCLIPRKSESRGTIITAFVFDLIPLIASIGIPLAIFDAFGIKDADKIARLIKYLASISIFFSVAALFVFVIFARMLAYYIQKALLASEALNLVSWLMIMVGAAPAALLGMQYLSPIVVGAVGGVINLGLDFIITLVWFGMFYFMFFQAILRLLGAERSAIADLT
jgi:hypothetical protein